MRDSISRVPEGAIRYNTDSNKMEVWIGDKWMQVAVSSPNLDGGARGFAIGGNTSPGGVTDKIDFINIASAGNAQDFGDMVSAKRNLHGGGNQTRGLMCGGLTDQVTKMRLIL